MKLFFLIAAGIFVILGWLTEFNVFPACNKVLENAPVIFIVTGIVFALTSSFIP